MTKLNIVNDALTEISITSYVYNLQPEDFALCLTRLEALVAQLDVDGIELNWPYAEDLSNVAGNVEVQIPAYAYTGLVALLAIDVSAAFGKAVPATTQVKAKLGYEAMLSVSAVPNPIAKNQSVPIGSGNKGWRMRRVFVLPDKPRRIDPDQDTFVADIGAKRE